MNVNGRAHFLLQIGFWSIEMMATPDQNKKKKKKEEQRSQLTARLF
jgi:hypothetical protein